MKELIRTENLLGGSKTLVGSVNADLILQSLGKIYIQQGKSIKLLDDIIRTFITTSNESVLITTNKDIKYPGDNKLIYNTDDNTLYITNNGKIIPLIQASTENGSYVKKSGDSMSGTLNLKNPIPLTVNSTSLINNLNSNYLEGFSSEDFPRKTEDANIDGKWNFKEVTTFKKTAVIEDKLSSPEFQSGFQGFGWRLDSETNTLTIDNLVVRKIMQVFELVINKIKATNGSLWVTNSAKIKNIYYFDTKLPSAKFIAKNGSYTFNNIQCNGNYFETINGVYPLPDTESLNKGLLNHLKANIKVCKDSFETNGLYDTINIYERYFNKKSFVIEIDQYTFDAGDLLTCQKLDDTKNIISYDLLVISYLYSTGTSGFYLAQQNNESKISVEDDLVQYGNINNPDRQGSFYITSTDPNSPYALVISGANNPDYKWPYKRPVFTDSNETTVKKENNKYQYEWIKSIKVRLGKLDGQWDEKYLDDHGNSTIKGWGLYGENVYLTGSFYLNNGKSVVDFTQDGILLKFKNAGLEIKDISVTNPITHVTTTTTGIVLTAANILIKNPYEDPNKPHDSDMMFTYHQRQDGTYQAIFNTDLLFIRDAVCKNTKLSKYGFDEHNKFKTYLNLQTEPNYNPLWAFYEDGHGLLAGGNIRWQADGQLDIRGTISAEIGSIAGLYMTRSRNLAEENFQNFNPDEGYPTETEDIKDYLKAVGFLWDDINEKHPQYMRSYGYLATSGILALTDGFYQFDWTAAWVKKNNLDLESQNFIGISRFDGYDNNVYIRQMIYLNNKITDIDKWQSIIYNLKKLNYKNDGIAETQPIHLAENNPEIKTNEGSILMPYSNGIFINKYSIKQKLHDQILSYNSTILNLNYMPILMGEDLNRTIKADAVYSGYFGNAPIGIYNYQTVRNYNDNTDRKHTNVIAIDLDEIFAFNTQFTEFFIDAFKRGQILINVQGLPLLKLPKPDNMEYNGITYDTINYTNVDWNSLYDNKELVSNVGYNSFKKNSLLYNYYFQNNTTNHVIQGYPINSIYFRWYKEQNHNTYSLIMDSMKYHELFTGEDLYTGSINGLSTEIVSFRFKSDNKLVGAQDPYRVIFEEVLYNKVTTDKYNIFKGYQNSIYIRSLSEVTSLTTNSGTYYLRNRKLPGLSVPAPDLSKVLETIDNYILISTIDDNTPNYNGFNLQITYIE